MYEFHPSMINPENDNIKIWRYMDFTKLVSLLNTQTLFFTRADKFEDTFEGAWTKPLVEFRTPENWPIKVPEDLKETYFNSMKKHNEEQRKYIGINCWHENEHESAAMWKLYLKSEEGVAVQTTFKRLKNSFIDEELIYLSRIKYIDYDNDLFDINNLFNQFIHKRKSFEHEKEIRAMVFKYNSNDKNGVDITMEYGVSIKVDLNSLIERIYVSPTAPKWFLDLTHSIVEKYGFKFEIIQSELYGSPLF